MSSFCRYGVIHESSKEKSLDDNSYLSKVYVSTSIQHISVYYGQYDCVSHWVVIMMIGAAHSHEYTCKNTCTTQNCLETW